MPALLPEIFIAQFADGSQSEDPPSGYLVQPAPRRAARSRGGEILFTALSLQARTRLPAAETDKLSHLMAQVYFETPGSVTAALRAAFTAANAEVLPFSQTPVLAGSPAGSLVQLHAVCSVLRDTDLYLGYAGSVLALILRDGEVECRPQAGDPPARALGTTLNLDLHYGHTILSPAATLILAASPPAAWSASVPSGLANLSLQAMGQRLAQQSASQPGTFGTLLVRFAAESKPAKAPPLIRKLTLFPSKKSAPVSPVRSPQPSAVPAAAKPLGPHSEEPPPRARARPERQLSGPAHPAPETPSAAEPETAAGRDSSILRPASLSSRPVVEKEESPAIRVPPRTDRFHKPTTSSDRSREEPQASRLSAREAAAAFGHSINVTLNSAREGLRSFLAGILPRGVMQENDRFVLPPAVMLGTAIAIPLLVVAVVAVMYFRKGYEMEFARLMEQARTEASVAGAQTDPLQARQAWQQVFDTLQTASQYGSSEELTTLENHAARLLDDFDGITPLEFKPVVAGGLDADTQITVILAGDRELYALDAIHDRILRLLLGQGGYQVDDAFLCQSGDYPDITVESLVDMVWVPDLSVGAQTPTSTRGGAVVALDRKGTLLYCPPGGKAMAGAPVTPGGGWSTPSAVDYYNGRLYILDPESNAFWRYGMSGNTGFDQAPTAYFSGKHPSMTDAIDFVVASGEVFFLHAGGHVTRCQYDPLFQPEDGGSVGGTLCEDIPYNDTRPGRTAGPRVADALLTRIYYNEPPEPTLFFLDPLGRGAFRFSLALNFISRYRVTTAPDDHEATALAIGSDKVLYIAIGNQIYYAQTRTP
ncbi:MAG: hypothetical protein JW929_07145 [Anaerolineales bacterium]|nr:hypothetical protein [Anaerolineales bacterium]